MFRPRHLYVIKTGAYKIEQTVAKDIPKEKAEKTIYVIHLFLKKRKKRERGSLGKRRESHLWFYQVFLSQIRGENKRKKKDFPRSKQKWSIENPREDHCRSDERKFLSVFFIMGLAVQSVTALQKGVSEGKYIRRRE